MTKECTITLEDGTQQPVIVKYEYAHQDIEDTPYLIGELDRSELYEVISITCTHSHIQAIIDSEKQEFINEVIEQL